MSEIDYGNRALAIVKKDAIEDGIDSAIVERLHATRRIKVISSHVIRLSVEDTLKIYNHELETDPTEIRQALIAMNAIAMDGSNLLVGLKLAGFSDIDEALLYLETIKGKVGNVSEDSNLRSEFPFIRPTEFDGYPFWFRAAFFVRNRVHTPHDGVDLRNVEEVAFSKGLSIGDIYPSGGEL